MVLPGIYLQGTPKWCALPNLMTNNNKKIASVCATDGKKSAISQPSLNRTVHVNIIKRYGRDKGNNLLRRSIDNQSSPCLFPERSGRRFRPVISGTSVYHRTPHHRGCGREDGGHLQNSMRVYLSHARLTAPTDPPRANKRITDGHTEHSHPTLTSPKSKTDKTGAILCDAHEGAMR